MKVLEKIKNMTIKINEPKLEEGLFEQWKAIITDVNNKKYTCYFNWGFTNRLNCSIPQHLQHEKFFTDENGIVHLMKNITSIEWIKENSKIAKVPVDYSWIPQIFFNEDELY